MWYTKYPVIIILIIFFGCSKDDQPKKVDINENLDIILIIGQSNTHYGLGLDSSLDAPDDQIFQLGRSGDSDLRIIKAVEPLDHHTKAWNRIGFGLTFAKLYVQKYLDPDRNVLIIPSGYGGSGFINNKWNRGNVLYEDAVLRVKYVISNFPGSDIVAILWHQGEIDVGNPEYRNDLEMLISDIREDIGSGDIPFILGGMVPYWVGLYQERIDHQYIISDIPNRIQVTGYADPNLPFIIEKVDNNEDTIHYNAAGMRELGRRYFSEFINLY